MGHSHSHIDATGNTYSHSHADDPGHEHDVALIGVPEQDLSPDQSNRRRFLRDAGLLGAGAAAVSVFAGAGAHPAFADEGADAETARRRADQRPQTYLAGDHHIHTQFSSDGLYRVADHTRHAAQWGLDWMVITDHGSVAHSKIGVEHVNPGILEARAENPRMLVFQGLEWNIPAAEHGTVFVAPGPNEVAVLKQFEQGYDGVVRNATDGTPGGPNTGANEALAIAGLRFLAQQKGDKVVADALMLANHPARKGLDSPHEIRNWRDAAPGIAIGMEGAPGHQAAGIRGVGHETNGRGYYDNAPGSSSFPGYPLASYVTYGGFDWMTATVGGLWDALLAEGKPWWITANSDSHTVFNDDLVHTPFPAGQTFDTLGQYPDPVSGGRPVSSQGDFWPGYYSRTHVGVERYGYLDVMNGIRAGNVWVDHGQLLDGLDVRVVEEGQDELGVTLGSFVRVLKGRKLSVTVTIDTASRPNFHGQIPKLARVDLIRGSMGKPGDADSFLAPNTRVIKQCDVSDKSGRIVLHFTLGATDKPYYIRLRGTDGNRSQPGLLGAHIDPAGPAADVRGDADPWADLWFYTNPIFVDVH